ncbi:hypothetical protein ZIOFF_023670 [Zingiber officinale]|uniref:valine--tRNA ligase n=1 Tax=Zingiber officinale TaxID=94328 RepID=A0A8J5LCX2_ZINOF|nr:hypothetical protein ZIOFF_023670 [Zingiber officinale]
MTSLDWSREGFTMDDARSMAVTEAFVRLYKQRLIYRNHRLVNWDCALRTAISDIEITPAHDPNDFEVGKRHNLAFINIFTDEGKINSNGGVDFGGMPRFAARAAVLAALKAKVLSEFSVGLYRGAQKNEMKLGICSRIMSDNDKKIEIIPHQYEQEWKRWLENIQDWCISRQLWWGHQVPAWYVILEDDQFKDVGSYNDHWVVGRNEQEALMEANKLFSGKKFEITQDPDVLDTWFSAGLFPLSVLGWPDVTPDFKAFYPTSLLETGHDIIFFWVARMVMLGMQLGGDVPFSKYLLQPVGDNLLFSNGIPECGADALRLALVSYTAQSDKINLDVLRVIGYRQWCNKLWNAIHFAMLKLGDGYVPPQKIDVKSMPPVCQWILSVLNNAVARTISSFESYKFSDATTVCLPQAEGSSRKESIMISEYPSVVEAWSNAKIENDMDIINGAVRKLRSLRPQSGKNERYPAFALCRGHDITDIMRSYEFEIVTLAAISSLKVLNENDMNPAGCAVDVVNENLSVYLQLQGTLDAEAEQEKKHDLLAQEMNSSGYKEKAPLSIEEEQMMRLNAYLEELTIIDEGEHDLERRIHEQNVVWRMDMAEWIPELARWRNSEGILGWSLLAARAKMRRQWRWRNEGH